MHNDPLNHICDVQEFRDVSKGGVPGIQLQPNEDNIHLWSCTLDGPEGTVYHGGRFDITLRVPEDYPLSAPAATFRTRIFHPNIHFKTGEVCLDILKSQWTPAWTLLSVAQAILSMLSDCNADSPLNCDAGNLIRCNDMKGFNSIARMYTVEYALRAEEQ
jgi:peroxin-4